MSELDELAMRAALVERLAEGLAELRAALEAWEVRRAVVTAGGTAGPPPDLSPLMARVSEAGEQIADVIGRLTVLGGSDQQPPLASPQQCALDAPESPDARIAKSPREAIRVALEHLVGAFQHLESPSPEAASAGRVLSMVLQEWVSERAADETH